MTLLEKIIQSYPMSGALFMRWIESQNKSRPLTPYLKQPIEDLPEELLFGVLLLFLEDNGIAVASTTTNKGRYALRVFRKGYTGLFRKVHHGKQTYSAMGMMKFGIKRAFVALEKRCEHAIPKPPKSDRNEILIGIDVEEVLQRARAKERAKIQILLKDAKDSRDTTTD